MLNSRTKGEELAFPAAHGIQWGRLDIQPKTWGVGKWISGNRSQLHLNGRISKSKAKPN